MSTINALIEDKQKKKERKKKQLKKQEETRVLNLRSQGRVNFKEGKEICSIKYYFRKMRSKTHPLDSEHGAFNGFSGSCFRRMMELAEYATSPIKEGMKTPLYTEN
jgi:hypothetical protein